ncbi:MAG: protein kinase [Pseudanabaena sp. ELA607]
MAAKVLSNRYKLIKALGAGGFGRTFIARDMQRPGAPPCVVKQLKPASNDPNFIREARRLFETEAATLERLGKHDQIPQLLAYFEEGQQFFLVQEFIDGQALGDELKAEVVDAAIDEGSGSLTDLEGFVAQADQRDKQIKKGKCLSEGEVITILRDVLAILEFVHAEGVIHRDIKPDNLIRRKADGKIVLIDFGAVRAMQEGTQIQQTESGESRFTVTIGTPGYMPSEQCAGRPYFTSDLYALGMVCIRALTGIEPTDLPTDPETGEVVWKPHTKVSNGLGMVLTRMVKYHYTQRYQSVRDALQGLQAFAIPEGSSSKPNADTSSSNANALTKLTNTSLSDKTGMGGGTTASRRVTTKNQAQNQASMGVVLGVIFLLLLVSIGFALPFLSRRTNTANKSANPEPSASQPFNPNSPQPLPTSVSASPDATTQPVNPANPPSGDNSVQPLTLQLGQTSNLTGNLKPNGSQTYTFEAKAQQQLKISLASTNGLPTSFALIDGTGQSVGSSAGSMVNNFEGSLPNNGMYTLVVRPGQTNKNDVPYQMTVLLAEAGSMANSTPNPTGATPTPTPQIEIKVNVNKR